MTRTLRLAAAEIAHDALAFGFGRFAAGPLGLDVVGHELFGDVARVFDRSGEHQRLHPRRVLFVRCDDARVAVDGVDGRGQRADHEVAAARGHAVEVGRRRDRERFDRNEIARVDRFAGVHLVDDLLEDVDEPHAVAAIGRGGEAHDHRVAAQRQDRGRRSRGTRAPPHDALRR